MDKRGIRLDLGCGTRKLEGHIGVDKFLLGGVDMVCDVERGLSIKDNSVSEIYSNYFLEHTADIVSVFREIYRICKNNALIVLTVPYYTSINAFKDPTHQSFFTEDTFRYFSRADKWYGSDYDFGVDFKVRNIKYHYSTLAKILPFKKYIRRYFMNMVGAITVELEVIK